MLLPSDNRRSPQKILLWSCGSNPATSRSKNAVRIAGSFSLAMHWSAIAVPASAFSRSSSATAMSLRLLTATRSGEGAAQPAPILDRVLLAGDELDRDLVIAGIRQR